ncbi:MAG: hypothetical protein Phog2KO_12740 [Phototrophicaceae bacterium]
MMRRLIFLILCLLPFYAVSAQVDSNFSCDDTNDYRSQLRIIPPDITGALPDVTVTAIGQDTYEPVLGIITEEDVTDCYIGMENSANGFVYSFGENTVYVSELNGQAGQVRLIFEALILDSEHLYQFEFSQGFADNSETDITATLISFREGYIPSLRLDDGEEANAIDMSNLEDFSEGNSAVSATMSMAQDFSLTIAPNELGIYALVIDLTLQEIAVDDGIATVTRADDRSITLACDDDSVYENGLEVSFPSDNTYTATVLANTIDSVLAVVDADDSGFCYDNAPTANYYFADLPIITMTPNRLNAQADISEDSRHIIFGGRDSAEGDYVLMIEGGNLSEDNLSDIFEISLTPQMMTQNRLLRAYVFAVDASLNPILTWQDATGDLLSCDSAGNPDLCEQENEDFLDASLALGLNRSLLSVSNNPMLEIPVNNLSDLERIQLRVSADEDTSGAYVLVLYVVTD